MPDNYEGAVVDYLRADRALFVNTQCCIQLNESNNPDTSGPHWYCDAVAVDFREGRILLCEISYSRQLGDLTGRLKAWHEHWPVLRGALNRDSHVPADWPARPWLFVPEDLIPLLLKRLEQIAADRPLAYVPLVTSLEMVQPWLYHSWDRRGEVAKPDVIQEAMRY